MRTQATARFIRVPASKARLVLDHIRGKSVGEALSTLQFTPKAAGRLIEKVLRSAIANAQQKEVFGGDVERLFVNACYANQGPSQKRIRPAPMGRAFRVVKRTAHLTVQVAEKPSKISVADTAAEGGAKKRARGASPKPKAKAGAKRGSRAKAGAKTSATKKTKAAAAATE